MTDHEAQAEAWVRKKPIRTIQNQTVIMLLLCLVGIAPFALSGFILWLVFCVCPSVMIPVIVVFWPISSIVYLHYRGK